MAFLLLPVTLLLTLVHGVPVLEIPRVVPGNSGLSVTREQCNRFPDWIEDGILQEDCQAAINELYYDDVEPCRGQEYEFLRKFVRKESYLPYWLTPRKHWYRKWSLNPPNEPKLTRGGKGTCVVEIVMLDTFMPGSLPGEASDLPTLKSDTTTFDSIWEVANSIFNVCVKQRQPMAGWSYAGMSRTVSSTSKETSLNPRNVRFLGALIAYISCR